MLSASHQRLGGRFDRLNAEAVVVDFGDVAAEQRLLTGAAGVLDFGFRGRLCVLGNDRARFLHGQVTNDIKRLRPGEGCYAALVTAKGKMQSDLNVFALADELLLDFEPGLAQAIAGRINKFIVADDVQVVDVAALYGLISVQGPRAADVVKSSRLFDTIPETGFGSIKAGSAADGELYLINHPRLGGTGFDVFAPRALLATTWETLLRCAAECGGGPCGWEAFERARIEAGIPRFGADMDETNIPIECGIESRAISYTKGCYIGQEVLNRIHSIGRVNRMLRRLTFNAGATPLPVRGGKLFSDNREIGHLTSVAPSGAALGYVHRDADGPGGVLELRREVGASVSFQIVQQAGAPFTAARGR
jgi:folate-binding protein YgfZ